MTTKTTAQAPIADAIQVIHCIEFHLAAGKDWDGAVLATAQEVLESLVMKGYRPTVAKHLAVSFVADVVRAMDALESAA